MTGTYDFAKQAGKCVCVCKDTGTHGYGDTNQEAQADCENKKMGLQPPIELAELMNVVVPPDFGSESGKRLAQANVRELDKLRTRISLPHTFREHLNQYLTHPDIARQIHADDTRPTDVEDAT